jgi:inner membrane transporter RhtA
VNRRALAGVAMIVGTSASIQIAAAIAHDLFDTLTPAGVSALRFALGTAIVLPAVRPSVRGRDRETWVAITVYGISLGILNVTFFQSFQRLPLGLAVTFAFVGPLCAALAGSRHRRDIGFALLAAAGVVVLGGIDRPGSAAGVAFALVAGCAWVSVAFAGRAVGQRTRRIDGLALAIPVAFAVTLPFGLGHAGAIDGRALALGVLIAVGGMILPFALELEGLRRLEPRTVAVIYSADPAIAAVIGVVALSESLTPLQVLGIAAVIAASCGVTAGARAREPLQPSERSAAAAASR